jgi:hypothetical protein
MKNPQHPHVDSFITGLGDSIRHEVKGEGAHELVKLHGKIQVENTDLLQQFLLDRGMMTVVPNVGVFSNESDPDCTVNLSFEGGVVELDMKVLADFESNDEAKNMGIQCRESMEKVQGLIRMFIASA